MPIVYVFQMAVRNMLPRLCKPVTEARYVDNIHCMLGNISSFFDVFSSADFFFQVKLPNFSFPNAITVLNRLDPNQDQPLFGP